MTTDALGHHLFSNIFGYNGNAQVRRTAHPWAKLTHELDTWYGVTWSYLLAMNSTDDTRTTNNVMRHEYRKLTNEEKQQMQHIKDKGLELHRLIESVGQSRELSLAKTKAEEAVMWAVKHITA